MHQVRFAASAVRDLQRMREFLRHKNPAAAQRAGQAIAQALQVLGHQPLMGRPVEDLPDNYREWIIDFGNTGYVARYRVDAQAVVVLAVRHQKEAGF